MDKIINNINDAIKNGEEKARLAAIDMNIEKVLDVIAEVYSEDHTIIFNTCGISGIEDPTGKVVEIDFESIVELYEWAKKKL